MLRQFVAEIPLGQNILLLERVIKPAARQYYLEATAKFGWTRDVLLNQIKADAYSSCVIKFGLPYESTRKTVEPYAQSAR